jgi:AraC-like DNA-binding protein
MVDVTERIEEVGKYSRDIAASHPEPRRPLDPAATEVLVRVAHEMRQPLSAVSAAITLIKDDDADRSRREHACRVLERQCTRLSRLVEDLLVVARTGRDITALSREKVDLHALLSELAETLRPSAGQREQQLEVLLPPGPCWVQGDPVRLEQVFSNIINNAIKYTGSTGRIGVTSTPTEHHAVISIADTGCGVAPEVLSKVFEMFTTGADQGRGLGVGLAVARHLVTLHGGSIDISSEGPDRGTEVVVKLPRVSEAVLAAEPDAPKPSHISAAQEHVRRMLDRIEQSYSEPITLRSLAAELHRQSAYLGGMFRRMVGMSVHQWLTTVRLDRASTLIREGVKVEAVSLLVGYRSKKNFYRQFKRRFGTTPFEHRNTARTHP